MSPIAARCGPTPRAQGTCHRAMCIALVFTFALAYATSSAAQSRNARQALNGVQLPDNPLQGRLLFEQRLCNRCHRIAGDGPGIGPDLGKGHFVGRFLDLGAALWNHVPGMSVSVEAADMAWPELSDDEAVQLIAFLYYIEYLGRPGDPITGRKLFASKGCAACHTVGDGGDKVGPDLGELRHFASPLYIAQAIWNHGPSMLESMRGMAMRPPEFDEGDLADLSAYLRHAVEPVLQERLLLAPGNPNQGHAVFDAKGCSSCHAVRGRGGREGPDLSESSLHRSAEATAGIMWNHSVTMIARMRDKGLSWPRFTTPELADLIAYLYFLPFDDPPGDPKLGLEVFTTRSCVDCHAGEAGAMHPGPDLAGSDAARSPPSLVASMWNHAPFMKEAILAEGRPWPELTGDDLRNLLAFLRQE